MTVVAYRLLDNGNKAEQSVVLRRQVPIRFEETARSWFGGLPQMPGIIAWPRAATNGAALNFIAQICCADLPKQLWGGRGPREGWLLLFAEYRQLGDGDTDDSFVQVLHINRLGPERRPPGATMLRSILNRFKTSAEDGNAGSDEPPRIFRRWPVDIVIQDVPPPPPPVTRADWVPVHIEGEAEDQEFYSAPLPAEWLPLPVTGEDLYGAPVDDTHIGQMLSEVEPRPRTWRAVQHMLEKLVDEFTVHDVPALFTEKPTTHCSALQQLAAIPSDWGAGWLAKAKAEAAAALAKEMSAIHEMELQLTKEYSIAYAQGIMKERRYWLPIGERNCAELAPYSGSEGEKILAEHIKRDAQRHARWVENMRVEFQTMGAQIRQHPLDADMPDAEWSTLKARMKSEKTKYWFKTHSDLDLRNTEQSLLDYALRHLGDTPVENLLDTYARSAAARASIPSKLLTELEAKLRHINSVPHRCGGPRDAVQGWGTPDDGDLLFQIGSDDAMGWMWADLGALFVYCNPTALKARRFGHLTAWLDGG